MEKQTDCVDIIILNGANLKNLFMMQSDVEKQLGPVVDDMAPKGQSPKLRVQRQVLSDKKGR